MPPFDFNQLLIAMKSVLLGAAHLSYNEIVDIRKHRANALPDFNNFAIILSPRSEKELHEYAANSEEREVGIDVVFLVRNYHPVNSVTGTTAPNIGILKHVDNGKKALRSQSYGGLIDVSKLELDGEVRYNEIQTVRDHFYQEAILPWVGTWNPQEMPEVV